MGRIDRKELTKILLFWIVFCISIFIAEKFQIVFLLLFAFLILGLFLISIFKAKHSNWTGKTELLISLIFSGILFISQIAPFYKKLEHSYFKNNIEHFDNLIDPSKLKLHRFIFAFDNSGGQHLIEKKLSESVLSIHRQYCNEVKKYYSTDCFSKNDYRDILKSRMCFDLSHVNCMEKNQFLVLKIGNPDISYFTKSMDDFIPCNEKNIKSIIEQICVSKRLNSIDGISHFENFYRKIQDITMDENYTYTLFMYSDFVHDLNTMNNIEDHCSTINTIQNNLIRPNITQNLFIAPPYGIERKNLRLVERSVLPSEKNHVNHYEIDFITPMTNICHEIKETNELLVLYQYNQISDAVTLIFKGKEETFIQFIENGEGYAVYDGNRRYYYSENNPIQSDTITIKYEKNTLPRDVLSKIQITQKGIHYIVQCKLEKNEINLFLCISILICCVLAGVILPKIIKDTSKT